MPDNEDCDCAPGCCDSRYNGLSRRNFIALAGVGAAGLLATPAWADWVKRQGSPVQLAAWKADLFRKAPVRKYLSSTHADARMPLGGIGTGNFDIGSDGRFTTWQLFNTLRDGYVPFCFAVNCSGKVRLLQTTGGPDWPRVTSVEMTGEYPFATLKYTSPDLPVDLQMTAFTPFSPLDAEFSAMPAACFVFRAHNPTAHEVQFSLAGFLQNAVGYDAIGVPISFNSVGFNAVAERQDVSHPNFGRNFNRVYRNKSGTVLAMEAQVGAPPTLDRSVHLYTNLDARALNSPPKDRPEALTISGLDRMDAATRQADASNIIWFENAAADLSVEHIKAARKMLDLGATVIFSGASQPLLKAYAEATKGRPHIKSDLQPDVVFDDFENGYANWSVVGDAFGTEPAHGTLPGQQEVTGFLGRGLVNSFLKGDGTTGKMTSKPFTIERRYIRFLVGGGRSQQTQIRLFVDGKRVRAASGKDDEKLLPALWEVGEYAGKQAHIEIVDEATGGWGHINIDNIVFSDDPGNHGLYALLDQMLPVLFSSFETQGHTAVIQQVALPDNTFEHQEAGYRLLTKGLGSGNVHLLLGDLIAPENLELIGARQRAYEVVCKLGWATYTPARGVPEKAPGFGALALMALDNNATVLREFTDWREALRDFGAGHFQHEETGAATEPTPAGSTINGAVASMHKLAPGAVKEIVFCLAWRYPNKYNGAGVWMGCHYAEQWKTVESVTQALSADFAGIHQRTQRFRDAMYDSTLPYWLLDCVTSQISTIRHSGVVFRIANGDVFGWEGSNGCCQPTCTHVWGYEQTLAHLFPSLERQMREIDYKHQQRADGGVDNRTDVPSPPRPTGEQPFTDGHCSCILKACREALNAPDDSFLRDYWPHVKRAVEYLIDRDAAASGGAPTGVLSDDQWNTYDNSIHGVNTFIGTYYLAALRAGEEMARLMHDNDTAGRFNAVFQKGSKKLVDMCWNGEYFEQHLPDYMKRQGEYGPGCLSDQLIGQWWAHQLGLGYLLPQANVQSALKAIFKYNWLPDFTNFQHNWRKFAGGNDKGLLICTWPKGGRPANTIPYVDEVWTGVEYQVASHMIYEGLMEDGLAIVKGARDRYNGVPRAPMPRSPWNEIECGGHYARAMSSWSLVPALSGFRYDTLRRSLAFRPRHSPENHRSLFTAPESWGALRQIISGSEQHIEIAVLEGKLRLKELSIQPVERHLLRGVPLPPRITKLSIKSAAGQRPLAFTQDVALVLHEEITIRAGETLTVSIA